MSNSMGSTNPMGGQANVNTSLQQMVLMNMSGLDNSTSMINERVQIELENLMDDMEEQKIQHERLKRDELKIME
jgi:hypothetical protein